MTRRGSGACSTALLLCLALCAGTFAGTVASAQEFVVPDVTYPSLPKQAATAGGFVPQGWTLEDEASGDLNRDGIADIAFVLRQEDSRNLVTDERFGPSPFNTNPRILAVAFRSNPAGDYTLQAENHTLIPRCENPNQEDPFEGIAIQRGGLRVRLRLFMNAGGWDMFTATHAFQYREGRFQLIGYDRAGVHRASGETGDVSANYLTGRIRRATGHISRDKPDTVVWRTLPRRPRLTLDAAGDGLDFDPER